jgi:hypothetical protein
MSAVAGAIVIDDIEGASEEGRFREQGVQAQPAKGSLMRELGIQQEGQEVFFPLLRGSSQSVWRTSTRSRATRVLLSKLVAWVID